MRSAIVLCAMLAPAAFAVDRGFGDVVGALSDEFHVRPSSIPLMGLVKAAVFFARPAGTRYLDVAVFHDIDTGSRSTRNLAALVRRAAGGGWAPFITVQSRKPDQEQLVTVFMRRSGRSCHLMVASVEHHSATVVELELDRRALERWLRHPEESAERAGRMDDIDESDSSEMTR